MGMVDYFRLPKRQWYWYRNEYRHIPPPAWPAPGTPARLQLTADQAAIHGTDATDDTQVVVTVLDGDGHPISNSPEVTLSIESGPGEFPTGNTLTFSPDSDIAIRDGQAAIEFRSYYAGTTIIRAHSAGLADATVTITTEGTPQYVPGQTPEAAARPYVRFTAKPSQPNLQTLGQDSPTQASSEAPDHPARLANDGNDTTCWSAANAATNAWWEVDLERLSDIKRVQLTFPTADNYRYKIETSDDRRQWRPAADETHTTATTRTRPSECVPGSGGRFVRITFTGLPPGALAQISEVKIIGMVRSP